MFGIDTAIIMLIVMAISMAASIAMSLFASKPKMPSEDKQIEIPNPTIGQPIGVLFGKRIIKAPFMAWYGDIAVIKVKVDAGGKK